MARKKKDIPILKVIKNQDIQEEIQIGEWKYLPVKKELTVLKPLRNEEGQILYSNLFRYLLKIMPEDHRDFDIVASLLTYVNYHKGLTDKQIDLAERIIDYWRVKEVLDA